MISHRHADILKRLKQPSLMLMEVLPHSVNLRFTDKSVAAEIVDYIEKSIQKKFKVVSEDHYTYPDDTGASPVYISIMQLMGKNGMVASTNPRLPGQMIYEMTPDFLYRKADILKRLKNVSTPGNLTIDWNSMTVNLSFCGLSSGDIERIIHTISTDFGITVIQTSSPDKCQRFYLESTRENGASWSHIIKSLRAFLTMRSSKVDRKTLGFETYKIDKHFMDML